MQGPIRLGDGGNLMTMNPSKKIKKIRRFPPSWQGCSLDGFETLIETCCCELTGVEGEVVASFRIG